MSCKWYVYTEGDILTLVIIFEVSITFRGLRFKSVMQILCICILILVIRHVGSIFYSFL